MVIRAVSLQLWPVCEGYQFFGHKGNGPATLEYAEPFPVRKDKPSWVDRQMPRACFTGLSRNVVLLAVASLFTDISTEMLYPVLPVFLTQMLGASGSILGLMDGCAQATQNIAQGLSGTLSDRVRKRKTIALAGYFLAALSKPLMGLSTGWMDLFGARMLDRLGTGTRSAPRDALRVRLRMC
ncbi:MFS transporter [Komagataeibacter swingsii]|uniref:MFS transporter n=1 Tax=Komagataeibacter swingsii TaxID=215220 RepID=UPI00210A1CDD|nr:MFS transporter [Komagataeibacter swingsii]